MEDKKNILPRLKTWLLQGKSITHNQAQTMWGTNRLAEFVRRLRVNYRMKITTVMVTHGKDRFGVYSIPKKVNRITSGQYSRA